MASFEQRDLVDYAIKKIEDLAHEMSRDYMREDLNKLWDKVRRLEEKVKKLLLELRICKIE